MVAFRSLGSSTWIQTVLASPDASRYVYRNDSVAPLSRFEVKVGVYNSMGEGQFSRVVRVLSAEEGKKKQKNAHSSDLKMTTLNKTRCESPHQLSLPAS